MRRSVTWISLVLATSVSLFGCLPSRTTVYSTAEQIAQSDDLAIMIIDADYENDSSASSIVSNEVTLHFRYLTQAQAQSKILREAQDFYVLGKVGPSVNEVKAGIYVLDQIQPTRVYERLDLNAEKSLASIHRTIQDGRNPDWSQYPGAFEVKPGEVINLGAMDLRWRHPGDKLQEVAQKIGISFWQFRILDNSQAAEQAMLSQFGEKGAGLLSPIEYRPLLLPEEIAGISR